MAVGLRLAAMWGRMASQCHLLRGMRCQSRADPLVRAGPPGPAIRPARLVACKVRKADQGVRPTFGKVSDIWMASCGGLATRLPVICTAAASQGPIANRLQDAIPPHKSHRRACVCHTLGSSLFRNRSSMHPLSCRVPTQAARVAIPSAILHRLSAADPAIACWHAL
jgi:hypothetical protein